MAVLKDLIVHGNSRFLNTSYFNQLKTDKIGAEEGIFNKIVATTGDIGSLTVDDLTAGKATVLSLLDVRGELHTNQWTNSNIATIDGSFYITPTIGVPSGTMTTTANSVVINGSNFPISSLYVNGVNSDNTATTVAWTSGSKVLVTGEILVNGVYMPLGTLIGTLSANATASQIQVGSITDNRYQSAESLAEIGTQSTALPCRNVKVSLYQTSRSSTLYPLGIFMTALGENGKTFLDIYGGGYAASTAVAGGFAKPVLRIGNLAGLPDVGGKTPVGYGIYTSNGYFSGTIVSKSGTIGGYTLDDTSLYSGTKGNSTTSGHFTLTTGTFTRAIDGTSRSNLQMALGAKFGVANDGTLYANGANITNINANNISTNMLSAMQAVVSNLSVLRADMGTITAGVIKHDTVGGTNGIWFSAATDTSSNVTVGNSGARKDWRLLVNNKFGVTTGGVLYASGGNFNGRIEATEGYFASSVTIGSGGTSLSTVESNASTALTNSNNSLRYARVGQTGSTDNTTAKPWYKFASISISSYSQASISFDVTTGYQASLDLNGRLNVYVRRDNGVFSPTASFIEWSSASEGVKARLDKFVLAYKENSTTNKTDIELWCSLPNGWLTLNFKTLSENGAAGPDYTAWTLYNTVTDGSQAAITSGYSTINSKINSASQYITSIETNNGITIKAINGTADTNTTTGNYIKLNASGLDIYNAGASVAFYGATARVGKSSTARVEIDSSPYVNLYNSSNKLALSIQGSGLFMYDQNSYKRAGVTSDGFILYDGASSSTTTQLGSFTASSGNATIKLGQEAANKFNILITDSAVSSKGPGILLRQGTNVLNEITANGMKLYLASDTTNSIAEFGETTRIGKTSTNHIELDYHSLKLIGKEGDNNTYLYVSDLRDENGVATITSSYIGDGSYKRFNLDATAVDTNYTVTVDGETAATSSKTTTYFILTTAPSINSVILATYTTADYKARAFTFGSRSNDSIGANSVVLGDSCTASRINSFATGSSTEASGTASFAEGRETIASGPYSHAEGFLTRATAMASHAEGHETIASEWGAHAGGHGTIAGYPYQTAIGWYNDNKLGSLLEIGNGSVDARKNALEVDWNGNLTVSGGITANGRNIVSDRLEAQLIGNVYPVMVNAERFGKFIWLQYKIGPISLGASSTVAILALYSDIRPQYETIVPVNITDANYATVGTGLIRFETGGWVYLVTPKSLSQTGNLYVMFTAFYLI